MSKIEKNPRIGKSKKNRESKPKQQSQSNPTIDIDRFSITYKYAHVAATFGNIFNGTSIYQ